MICNVYFVYYFLIDPIENEHLYVSIVHTNIYTDQIQSDKTYDMFFTLRWQLASFVEYTMAQDMMIYWGSGSAPCWMALMTLEEKGLQGYNQKVISFEKKEHKSEEVLKLNPRGQVRVQYN